MRHSNNDPYYTTRIFLISGLGFIYLIANLILFFQASALWGHEGLLPIESFISEVMQAFGPSKASAFRVLPSLFYFFPIDVFLTWAPVVGIIGSVLLIFGFANLPVLAVLWLIQVSFVNSGQLFYGYGWETQILEFTFLSFFFVPLWKWNLRKTDFAVPRPVIWMQRWMFFRLMLGAGLIKIRGDECWRDFTCLLYHYETQPIPHPLSYFFHKAPAWFNYFGVFINHLIELVFPFAVFGPKRVRWIAGIGMVLFQITLIVSGNLAWLNWLTLVMCLVCFDDEFFQKFMKTIVRPPSIRKVSRKEWITTVIFCAVGIWFSWDPAINLLSSHQAMNTSYSHWHFINSYGAFGSIGKERNNVVILGTKDSVVTDTTEWKEYKFKCAPIDIHQRPCLITPYHLHLDWQIWFSGMHSRLDEEWLFRLVVRLLENRTLIKNMFDETPFGAEAPRFIKMDLYRYRFADWKDWPEKWWEREFISEYMPPVSLETPLAQRFRIQ